MILTPKQKADELYSKMYGKTPVRTIISEIEKDKQCAKQCALIAVDEMQLVMTSLWDALGINENSRSSYLEEVKKEIEKL